MRRGRTAQVRGDLWGRRLLLMIPANDSRTCAVAPRPLGGARALRAGEGRPRGDRGGGGGEGRRRDPQMLPLTPPGGWGGGVLGCRRACRRFMARPALRPSLHAPRSAPCLAAPPWRGLPNADTPFSEPPHLSSRHTPPHTHSGAALGLQTARALLPLPPLLPVLPSGRTGSSSTPLARSLPRVALPSPLGFQCPEAATPAQDPQHPAPRHQPSSATCSGC